MEMLKQFNDSPIPFFKQVVFLYAGINGYLEKVPLSAVSEIEKHLYQKLDTSYQELAQKIAQEQELSEEIESSIKKLIAEVLKEGGYEEHA